MDSRMYPQGSQAVKSADIETSPTVTDLVEVRDATASNVSKWVSVLNLVKKLGIVTKAASATLAASDSGKVVITTGATGAVELTLPAKAAGLWYLIVNTVDQNLTITSDAVDTMVALNNAAADGISFVTATELIGAAIIVACDGTKWLAVPLVGTATIVSA